MIEIVETMPDAEYHARPEVGSSDVKQAGKDPSRVGQSKPDAPHFIFGRLVHCATLEPNELAKRWGSEPDRRDWPDALVTVDDMKRAIKDSAPGVPVSRNRAQLVELVREHCPNAMLWDDLRRDAGERNAGKTLVSGYDFRSAERIAEAVRSHYDVRRLGLLEDGAAERSWFAPVQYSDFDIGTVDSDAKCRPDYDKPDGFGGGRVLDLKTARAIGDRQCRGWMRDAVKFGYDVSAAWYLDVMAEHGEHRDQWSWVVVDKSTVDDGGDIRVEVITAETDFELFDNARRKIARALDNLKTYRDDPDEWARRTQREHVAMWPAWDLREG